MSESSASLRRVLTLRSVVFLGLAFLSPLVVFLTYGIVAESSRGMVPAAYVFVTAIMLLVASSYAKMIRIYPSAGSAYTYAQKSINPHVGFVAGWVILMDYIFTPMLNALAFALFVSAIFKTIPISVFIILFIVANAVINILGIRFTANLNTYLVIFQFLFVIIFITLAVKSLLSGMGTGTLFSSLPFYNPEVNFTYVIVTVPILAISFIGFDSVATLSEETIEPRKTLPKAIYLVVLIAGGLAILISYLLHSVHPSFHFPDPDTAQMLIAELIGGTFLIAVLVAGAVVATFASTAVSYASATRILYSMGRDGVLPRKVFAYISPRFNTPVFNIVIVASLSFFVLLLDLVTVTSFVSFGALFAFTLVHLSVVFHYFKHARERTFMKVLSFVIVPSIGALTTALIFIVLDKRALLLGTGWVLFGLIYMMYITKMFTQPLPELSFAENQTEDEDKHIL